MRREVPIAAKYGPEGGWKGRGGRDRSRIESLGSDEYEMVKRDGDGR